MQVAMPSCVFPTKDTLKVLAVGRQSYGVQSHERLKASLRFAEGG